MNFGHGLDALKQLQSQEKAREGGSFENKFTSLKSGDSIKVKISSVEDFIVAPTYNAYKLFNTFTPEVPPVLNDRGYPTDKLTPLDKVSKFYREQSEGFGDEMANKAYQFALKTRIAMGFYSLEEGKPIIIDFTVKQALGLIETIQKNHKKLGTKAFEVSKSGSKTDTTARLDVLDADETDLTEKELKAFENAPKEFDKSMFENLYFKRDEKSMLQLLHEIGFDVTLIGEEVPVQVEKKEEVKEELNPEDAF